MSVYKRGKVYWYDFWFNGERFQKSTRIRTRRDAEIIESAKKVELAQQAAPPIEGVHFFCFGGLVHTARWLKAMRQGRFELTANGEVHVGRQ